MTEEISNPDQGDQGGGGGAAIALDIVANMGADALEAVADVILAGIPDGAVLSAGVDNGDGTWTVEAGAFENLCITPPRNFAGDMTLTALATSHGGNTALDWITVSVGDTVSVARRAVDDPGAGNVTATITDEDGGVIDDTVAGAPDDVDETPSEILSEIPDEIPSEISGLNADDGLLEEGYSGNGPVVNDAVLSEPQGREVVFAAADLLGNDMDADGGALAVVSFDQPDHGAIVDNGDGTFIFMPDEGWSGDTSFTYTISDADGNTSAATASVTAVATADAPELAVEIGDPAYIDDSNGGMRAYPLWITAAAKAASGPLVVALSGVPDGAALSEPAAYDAVGDAWSIDVGGNTDLGELTMTVPDDTGDFLLTVSATSTDGMGNTFIASRIVAIDVDDDGEFEFSPARGSGDDLGSDDVDSDDDVLPGRAGDDVFGEDADGGAVPGGSGSDLFIFGAGDGSDYFGGGDGWADTVSLADADGTAMIDIGRTTGVDGDALDSIDLSDGNELAFKGVDKIEW